MSAWKATKDIDNCYSECDTYVLETRDFGIKLGAGKTSLVHTCIYQDSPTGVG